MQNPWNRDDATSKGRSGPRHSGVPNTGAGHNGGRSNPPRHDGPRHGAPRHNGAGSNGARSNGARSNGAGVNGAGVNGAGVNGARSNGAGVNGAGVNGAGVNGARSNGAGVNGAGVNGGRPRGLHVKSVQLPADLDELAAEPLDMMAVQADDELINALSAGSMRVSPGFGENYDTDDHVVAMLAAWRAEVDAEPIGELVTVEEASEAIVSGGRPRSRVRYLVPLAAAAAVLAIAFSGVAIGAHSAMPGDALWGVSKVLYTERAASVEAADHVKGQLQKATDALVAGNPQEAAKELAAADAGLTAIRSEDGQDDLAAQTDFLIQKAAVTPPGVKVDPTELSPPPRRAGNPGRPIPPRDRSARSSVPPSVDPSNAPVQPGGPTGSPPGQPDPSAPAHSSGSAEGGPGANPPQSLSTPSDGSTTSPS